jgi:hypothetical protein
MPDTASRRSRAGSGDQDAADVKDSVTEALNIARSLAAAGIPIAVAYPDPEGKTPSGKATGYALRGDWQHTSPNPAYVDAWRPGLALIAVMGCGLDLVDGDPRNGGDLAALDGIMPEVLGIAETPSGGEHDFVRSMGVRSRDGVLPGIDVKAGDGDGQGRGFAFIAPTVRLSKTTGERVAYRWIKPPDLSRLHVEDGSGEQLAALVRHAPVRASSGFSQPGSHSEGWTDPDIAQLIREGIPSGEAQQPILRDVVARLVGQGYDRVACWGIWQAIADRTTLTKPEWSWAEPDFSDMYDSAARKYGTRPRQATQASPADGEPDTLAARLLPGGCILDVPAVPAAVWGDDDDILWAEGQSLIIAGPDGTGKTTLAGNLIHARLGLGTGTVLGLPVKPGSRNILLLFMDRPQQAMAAFARLFTKDDRAILNTRSIVWRGPPPQDLARHTGMLAHLCMLADADTCVIDSLKDAALKLSDDETGAGWNQARQIAIEAGTQLLELHHPRKAQEGNRKPRKLDDLYGSRWISAGAGSVISLWGQAGDPVVDLTHLKPVVTTAGPWQMNIDGETGVVGIDHGIDLVEQIRYRPKGEGITAQAVAKLLTGAESPEKAAIEKARRKLDRKVAEGLLVRHDGRPGGVHGGVHATWHLPPFTEAFTDRSRPGQAFTPTEEPPRSRTGGDISPPERERWSPGPRPGESPLGYAQRLRRERAAEARP